VSKIPQFANSIFPESSLFQPLLKVMSYMRAVEYTSTEQDENIYPKLVSMNFKIGQTVYECPDQFSFFPLDYSPPGQLVQSNLVAPAAFVLDMSRTISTIEGFFSFVRQGLNDFDGGFGPNIWGYRGRDVGDTRGSVGYLSFARDAPKSSDLLQSLMSYPCCSLVAD